MQMIEPWREMIRQRAETRSDFDHPIVGMQREGIDNLGDYAPFMEKMLTKPLARDVLQSVRFGSSRQLDGEFDSGEHAADVDLPGASQVKRRAMIDRGTDDR